MTSTTGIVSALTLVVALSACTGEPGERNLSAACEGGLTQAENELSRARANGVGDSVKWGKAAALIAAGRVQQGFDENQNCVIKAREARAYIREM